MNIQFSVKTMVFSVFTATLPISAMANDPEGTVLTLEKGSLSFYKTHDDETPWDSPLRPFFDTYSFSTIEHGYLSINATDMGDRQHVLALGGANIYLVTGDVYADVVPPLQLVASASADVGIYPGPHISSINFSTGRLAPGNYIYQTYGLSGDNGAIYSTSIYMNAVPEAETYAMMLVGLGVLGFIGQRRRQKEINIQ